MANRKLIKDNYDLKYQDGSLGFVDALKAEPTQHLNKPGDYFILDDEGLKEKAGSTCDIDDMRRLINTDEWHSFDKCVLRPYFAHRLPVASVLAGGKEVLRQVAITGISPAQMIAWPLMDQKKQFPDAPEFCAFNDKALQEGSFAWALAVVRNYDALLAERTKAANGGEQKILNRLTWGLLAICLLSNIMDAGPLIALLYGHKVDFSPFLQWPPIAFWLLRVFVVILAVILAVGLCLLNRRCRLDVETRFKALLSAFQNITRQSSLHIGAMMKVRREQLDQLHNDLWKAAIMSKEVHWAEDPQKESAKNYRHWTRTRSRCIRIAMWVSGRRKNFDDLLAHLHNYILMGYAAQTARAEFEAHYRVNSWTPAQGSGRPFAEHGIVRFFWGLGLDRLIFIKERFWLRACKVVLILINAAAIAGFSIWLASLQLGYTPVDLAHPGQADELTLMLLVLKLACIALPLIFGVIWIYRLAAKLETPDEPKLILENIRGAMPDERYTALQVLEKAVTALVEHDANRLLTEEDKRH